jgi:hypothetical protein
MKVESHDGSRERAVLCAMITDDSVLARLSAVYCDDLFYSRWSNLIGSWSVKFFQKYGRAPREKIEAVYQKWAQRSRDADTSQLIANFLASLSGEYERNGNSDFDLDRSAEYLNEVRLRRLSEQISDAIALGNVTEAMALAAGYSKVEVGLGSVFNPFDNDSVVEAAFSERGESLVCYTDELEALGEFYSTALSRDSLVAVLAPEGVGKSTVLLDIAYTAMMQGRKVLYFEAGDNSQNQVMRRLMCRSAQAPWRPREVKFPTSLQTREGRPIVGFRAVNFMKPLSQERAKEALQADREAAKVVGGGLLMSCHATGTLSVDSIEGVMDSHERAGYVTDLICADYADIMLHPHQRKDPLHQIEALWQQLRSLSQKRHCLVLTATQATRDAYRGFLLAKQHVSGNKLKLANVNAMIGINQSEADKEQQCYRLNVLKLRSDEFQTSRTVCVAGCPAIGQPVILSKW